MPFSAAEGGEKKKKKSRQPQWGSRQRTGCPNYTYGVLTKHEHSILHHQMVITGVGYQQLKH